MAPPTTLITFHIVKAIPLSRFGDPAASAGFTSDLLPPGPTSLPLSQMAGFLYGRIRYLVDDGTGALS